jgi:MAP/microtubule affinity-regulating kinase
MKNMKANLVNNNNYKNIKTNNMTKSITNNNNINDNYLNSLRFKNAIRLNNKDKIYNYLPFLQSSSKDKISPPKIQKPLLVERNFNINTINSTGLNPRSESLGIKNIHQFYYNLHTLTKYNNDHNNSRKKNNFTHVSSNPIINSFNNNLTTNSNISNTGNNNIILNNMGSVNTNNYNSNENSKKNNYCDGNSRANTAGNGVENDYNNNEKRTHFNKFHKSNTPENSKVNIIDESNNKKEKNQKKNINIVIEDNKKDIDYNITKNNIKERALTVPYKNRKKNTINIDCNNNQNKDTKLVNEDKINFNELTIDKDFKKDKLSKYEIGEVLGKGAYAIVKIVRNKITNMKFAMKVYEKENLNSNSKKTCVFREIQILKKINHKNIAKLIEVINTEKQILIVQELIEGISLREYYNNEIRYQKGISIHKENIFKIIFRQIFDAMDYLHKHGMAHRDIKLENILIKKNYEIKIIDFGFGMYNPENKPQKFFCGTPNYMPPEIAEKKPYNGQLADMWSLGILVYKIFCADFPFKGKDEKELYKSIKIGKFTFANYTPEYAKQIINSLVVQDPNKRITCEDVLNSDWLREK